MLDKNTNNLAKRNSSIELLKVIAICFIVFSHGMPDGSTGTHASEIFLGAATKNIQYAVIGFIHNLGQIGNDIFVVCAAWFMLEKEYVKRTRITDIIGDCFAVSVIIAAAFLASGYFEQVDYLYIMKQFFPVMMGNSWYVTCYLLLYLIHPLLNRIIRNTNKQELLLINMVFIVLFGIISFISIGTLYFYSQIIGFIGMYLLTAYLKTYLNKVSSEDRFGWIMLAIGVVGWFAENIITNILGLRINILSNQVQRWNIIINPCYMLIALGALSIAKNHNFSNRVVNYFSSLSLLIYIIHCNRIIRDYVRFDFFDYILKTYTYSNLLLWVLVFSAINLFAGTLLAIFYKETLQKYVHRIFDRLGSAIAKAYKTLEEKVIRYC